MRCLKCQAIDHDPSSCFTAAITLCFSLPACSLWGGKYVIQRRGERGGLGWVGGMGAGGGSYLPHFRASRASVTHASFGRDCASARLLLLPPNNGCRSLIILFLFWSRFSTGSTETVTDAHQHSHQDVCHVHSHYDSSLSTCKSISPVTVEWLITYFKAFFII